MIDSLVAALFGAAPFCLAAEASRLARREALLDRAGRAVASRDPSRVRITRVAVARTLAVPAGLVFGAVVAGWPGAVAGVVAAIAVPALRRRRRESARRELLEIQLIDAVSAVASGLRAGLSLTLALRAAADEGEPPLAPTLRELVDRTSFGVPFEESLGRWTESMPTEEARLVAGILGMHRRTGGNAPAVLDQAARTLRERHEAARELRSLTAQARLSGAILGLLPIGFFLFLSATSRGDIAAAYRSPAGAAAILLGLAMQAAAFVWIRRLLRVEP